jgi:hypothetical protein
MLEKKRLSLSKNFGTFWDTFLGHFGTFWDILGHFRKKNNINI